MRLAYILRTCSLLFCFMSIPCLAWAQPAIQRVDFDPSEHGRATDYAYHWSPNRDAIAVDFYNRLEVFDLQTMQRMVDLGPPKAGAWVLLGWEPNNEALLVTRFASGGFAPRGYPVTIYDVVHASFENWLPQSRAMQKGQWSPDGRYVALTGLFCGVRVYDAHAARLLFEFASEGSMGQQLVWSPDSQAIAAVRVMPDYSERLIVAEVATHDVVLRAPFESGAASVLAWSPDSQRIIGSADLGRGVQVVSRKDARHCEMTHPSFVVDAAWSPDGRWFATSTVDGSVVVGDAADCSALEHISQAAPSPTVAWAPNHDTLAVMGDSLQLLHMPQARVIWSRPVSADAVAWAADGSHLAWMTPKQGVSVLSMRAIGDNLRSDEPVVPWLVPNTVHTSRVAWSKTRLRLHLAGVHGLTTVDMGALSL